MKKNLYLLICSISCIIGLQVLIACSSESENPKVTTKLTAESNPIFGESTEEKLDNLLTDYVYDMKSALAEKDDKKVAAKIQILKEEYSMRVEELQSEIEFWENSLSEQEKEAFEQRIEEKPYFQDLFTTSFSVMGRMNKSPELRKAFEELNSHMNFINEDISSEEATGEEYPEDLIEIEEDTVKE